MKKELTRRGRALGWWCAILILAALGWYGAGNRLNPASLRPRAMDQAAVGETQPVWSGRVPEEMLRGREAQFYLEGSGDALVLWAARRERTPAWLPCGWQLDGVCVLDCRGEAPFLADHSGYRNWEDPEQREYDCIYGRVKDPRVASIELWRVVYGEDETWTRLARLERRDFWQGDTFCWAGMAPVGYSRATRARCYDSGGELLYDMPL